MRIKSLQIHGFKSFVEKTVFAFEPGITGIVGPNGCGKSNVVDAMRWCMGEQSPRRLRGKGMEDVIFAGAEGRAPVGMAEVVLSFDNSDGAAPPAFAAYSEIQVARRIYRSGESEYLINKVPCRLRDVQDFFRDTGIGTKGYTIVEQGQIAGIVSAKPEERRYLIEEAAGISKYKARRREAESKIEATEGNLLRVNDVLTEIRRQIGSIERQARKAARYKRLRETQRLLDLSLAADERRDLLEGVTQAQARLVERRERVTALETRLAERELALEQARLELVERERALGQGSEVLVRLRGEIKEFESRIGYERREREALAEMNAARGEELVRLREQREAAEAAANDAAAELERLEAALAAEASGIAAAQAEAQAAAEAVRRLERERESASAALVEVATRVARLEDRLAARAERRAEIDRRLRSADEGLEIGRSESAAARTEEDQIATGLRNLLAERDRAMERLRAAQARFEASQAEARAAQERLHAARDLRERRRARLASLREVVDRREDLGAASRHLLELDPGERAGFGLRALVRDVLEADPAVEGAVEAVLAERTEALVVDRAEGALAALEALRAVAAGRGVFVAPSTEEGPTGFVPLGEPLLGRVRARPGFEGVARTLLAGVNLVSDLREVLRVYGARPPCVFVTPIGDILSPDGVLRGGGEAAGSGLLSRVREMRELEEEVARLDSEVVAREAASRAAEVALATASDEVENARSRQQTSLLAVASHEKDLERMRERVKVLGVAQEGRRAERSHLLAEADALAAEGERLQQQLAEALRERGERQVALESLVGRAGSAGRELARLEAALSARHVEHAGRVAQRDRLQQARRSAGGQLAETAAWIERRQTEIATADGRREALADSIREAEAQLARHLAEEEAARASNDSRREAYERAAESLRGAEGEVRSLRSDANACREAAGQLELAARERELNLQHLEQAVRERWGVDLAAWTPPALEGAPEEPPPAASAASDAAALEETAQAAPGEEAATGGETAPDEEPALTPRAAVELVALPREERQQRLDDVRRRIEALGEVNLGAIEEHEELSERFRFLSEQKNDLESTLTSLREAIQRINRASRKRFRETFEAVNERFQQNFPRLFRGGKAMLQLTEEEDVLDAGIEIVAQPPGKRLQNVNLLSGGEKTLTAVALLVSVFQVHPAPFFLLDEVDAALDDANVGRFNEIVRELSKGSQFLLITHNKRTIEIADILYGVTMEEKGVSKLVSVELH